MGKNVNFGRIDKLVIKHVTKKAFLRILANIENQKPERRIYLNLFNSGIIVDTEKLRNNGIKALRKVIQEL